MMTTSRRHGLRRALKHSLILLACVSLWPTSAGAICGNGAVEGSDCCPCDCNGDRRVTVDEILLNLVHLLQGDPGGCRSGACGDPLVLAVDIIVSCVDFALHGCPRPSGIGDSGEECDDGGLCVGGANAGTPCTSERHCVGDGACFGGIDDLHACVTDDECEGGRCRKCRPFGGDGCAANCTAETDHLCPLVPGPFQNDTLPVVYPYGSRWAIAPDPPYLEVPISLTGSQTFTFGKVRDGTAPVVIKTSAYNLDRIPVAEITCACVRGVELHTCGGTLFERDGAPSLNCSRGFVGAMSCLPDKACVPVHGPGNAGSGSVGCGLQGVDVAIVQDCNATPGAEPLDPEITLTRNSEPIAADQASGALVISSAVSTVVGRCTGTLADYGPDGQFCTADDPVTNRGAPISVLFTTNSASASVLNRGDLEGDVAGPIETTGAPFSCTDGSSIAVSGTNLAGAFTSCDQLSVVDSAATFNFVCE